MAKTQLNKEDLIQLGLLLLLFVGIFALGLHWWKYTRPSNQAQQQDQQQAPKHFETKTNKLVQAKQRRATKKKVSSPPRVKPTYLRMIQKKRNGDYWLEVKTNASAHYPVRLEFVGQRGSVLGYPSYRLLKTLRKASDFKLNASKLGIPAGRYKVRASVEGFSDNESLRLGTAHGRYQERLRTYKKQMSFSHMNEKRSMLRLLRKLRSQGEQLLLAARQGKLKSRRQVQSYLYVKNRVMQKINWRNRNSYVFAPEYYELKSILDKARKISPKSGQRPVKTFQKQLARLTAKVQQSSLW